jgi:excisionase family DNA binding protein
MSPQPSPQPLPSEDTLLTPREVAELFGVCTATIARWAREGRLSPIRTPGGHRRYRSAEVRELLHENELGQGRRGGDPVMVDDAVRLYQQGWSVRQVAARFECSYGAMRRILIRRAVLRAQSDHERCLPSAGRASGETSGAASAGSTPSGSGQAK